MRTKRKLLAVIVVAAFMLAGLSGCVKERFDHEDPSGSIRVGAEVENWQKSDDPADEQDIF